MGTITTFKNNGSSLTSLTVSSVAPSGSNRVMYVVTSHYPYTTAISSVAFNTSESLSLLDSRDVSTGSHPHRAEIWRLIAPSATTANVVVTFPSTVTAAAALVICRDNTDQTTPNNALSKGGNVSSTAPTIPTAFTWDGGDDVQFMALSIRDAAGTATITADAGVTEVDRVGGAGARVLLLTDQQTETGKVMLSATTAIGFNVFWSNFNEVSAGASNAPRSMYYALGGMR